ncbi:MAG TPA: iron chelate uptake ABC transporter family permease subunit, partial [Streptomyces sp.]|nr:iron chelate uptake ABC transporter family permease subunit [Streptomyces sp.]
MLVDSPPEQSAVQAEQDPAPRRRHAMRAGGLLLSLGVLVLVVIASIAIGAKPVPLDDVWHALFHATGAGNDVIVRDVRVPRTVLGVLVGAALGLSGAVMQ